MNSTFSYDDVLLVPGYSDIRSRSEIDISSDLGKGLVLNLPVIASPMDTISETPMALAMAKFGGSAVLHRYNSLENQCRMVRMAKDISQGADPIVGAAIGTSDDFRERATALVEMGVNFLCVDVAH